MEAGSVVTEEDIMTAAQVAAWLKVDRKTVYEYADRGDIPHRRLGKRLVFYRPALVDWLSCKSAPEEQS